MEFTVDNQFENSKSPRLFRFAVLFSSKYSLVAKTYSSESFFLLFCSFRFAS